MKTLLLPVLVVLTTVVKITQSQMVVVINSTYGARPVLVSCALCSAVASCLCQSSMSIVRCPSCGSWQCLRHIHRQPMTSQSALSRSQLDADRKVTT